MLEIKSLRGSDDLEVREDDIVEVSAELHLTYVHTYYSILK